MDSENLNPESSIDNSSEAQVTNSTGAPSGFFAKIINNFFPPFNIKKIINIVCALFAIFMIFVFFGSSIFGVSRGQAVKKLEKYLEDNYGEDFVIAAVERGYNSGIRDRYRIIFYPASKPENRSFGSVNNKTGEIREYYTGELVANRFVDSITPEIQKIIGGKVLIKAEINNGEGVNPEKNISITDFFKVNPSSKIYIGVLASSLNEKESSRIITEIGKFVNQNKQIREGRIYLGFANETKFDEMSSKADLDLEDIANASNIWININDYKLDEKPIKK